MEFLPDLDIQEDLELLAAEDNQDVSIAVQDLSKDVGKTAPRDIFVGKPTNGSKPQPQTQVKRVVKKGTVTPINDTTVLDNSDRRLIDAEEEPEKVIEVLNTKKAKKPLSEKQKAHLERIRIKALEAKREKARLKKEVKERVENEVREKRGRKKVVVVDASEKVKEQFIEKTQLPTPPPQVTNDPTLSFNNFMQNMEKYKRMKYDYQNKQLEATKKAMAYQQTRLVEPKPQPKPKPAPSIIVPPKPKNPYYDIFSW